MDMAVLPHHQGILLQVRHVVEGRERVELEHQPAHVSVEESLRHIVRVFLVIDMLVMSAMLASPEQRGVFKGPGAKQQRAEPHHPMRLKGQVRIKPVIAERDGKSGREEHEKEERDLEPVDSKEPDIDWDRSQGEKQCADEKRADEPVDSLEGYSRKHILAGQWKIRGRSAAIHHVTGCLREGHSSLDLPDRAIY